MGPLPLVQRMISALRGQFVGLLREIAISRRAVPVRRPRAPPIDLAPRVSSAGPRQEIVIFRRAARVDPPPVLPTDSDHRVPPAGDRQGSVIWQRGAQGPALLVRWTHSGHRPPPAGPPLESAILQKVVRALPPLARPMPLALPELHAEPLPGSVIFRRVAQEVLDRVPMTQENRWEQLVATIVTDAPMMPATVSMSAVNIPRTTPTVAWMAMPATAQRPVGMEFVWVGKV